jgi:hypothetical protein
MIYHEAGNAPAFNGLSAGEGSGAASSLDLLDRLEQARARARTQRAHERERRQESIEKLLQSWPIVVGMGLACIAPLLRDLLTPFDSWGMRILFPFVLLSARPEMQWGETVTRMLPETVLYLQFPLEGMLAKMALRGRVTVSGIAGQLCLIHFLAVVGLWLILAAQGQLAVR